MIRVPSLIPTPRLIRQKKRLRARGWAGVVVLTALLGGAGSAGARTWVTDPDAATHLTLAEAEQRLAGQTNRRDALRAESESAASTLRAVTAAVDHADWSILLTYVAKLCGDRITLDSLILEPDPDSIGFDLRMEGEGRSQQHIAAFILGLERSGVFASTRLENSGGGDANTSAIPFSVTCQIRPQGRPGPEKEGEQ